MQLLQLKHSNHPFALSPSPAPSTLLSSPAQAEFCLCLLTPHAHFPLQSGAPPFQGTGLQRPVDICRQALPLLPGGAAWALQAQSWASMASGLHSWGTVAIPQELDLYPLLPATASVPFLVLIPFQLIPAPPDLWALSAFKLVPAGCLQVTTGSLSTVMVP